MIQFVLVDTNDDTLALVDQRLFARGGLFDHSFWQTCFDRFRHATGFVDLLDNSSGLFDDLIGQRLNVIGSGQWIDGAAEF